MGSCIALHLLKHLEQHREQLVFVEYRNLGVALMKRSRDVTSLTRIAYSFSFSDFSFRITHTHAITKYRVLIERNPPRLKVTFF